ncbi:tyrosine-type recombinase/integrase [Acidiphilium iwatense]|uniref:Tyrosine-type recombinase/integrase n=1 Tax=Acidiphilium iwatense TaxID=768198 RepID=A0ABS9DU94_9PROT|nr:tyrosine-type recombinase/integrase [Acidiphilium iwatense]MCF3946294.1 tyrosine-type recombinase/integrase [Acidiphilium iwatense]
MSFLVDTQTLKTGLIIFRRADVKHRNWYCRIKLPNADRYKTFSLKTSDINAARDKAFDQDAEVRFSVKHDIPVFNKLFSQVAQEFSAFQKERAEARQISRHRWRVLDSHIRSQLNRYVGTVQISQIGKDRWTSYPIWRQKNGKGRSGGMVSEGTIRDEMATFRSILGYAARKHYIRESQIPQDRLPMSKARREEFAPAEYRKLHMFARGWVKEARNSLNSWYRTVAYNFVLIMANTGMRPSEAKNLQWRDVSVQTDKQGRPFVRLNVRGKGKHRHLVAASNVATYLDRIRAITKAKEPTDCVFTNEAGGPAATLYHSLVEGLLTDSGLLMSSSGSRRSTYCFRHTYATFRLTEGVDVYFLAKQMGTSVQMIEKHYGHVNPVKNADRILQGLPGWEPAAAVPSESR